jgi:DNA-binding CsgD family transcriptional regulator
MSTAGAPIHHPRTAQVLGALALVCSVEATNALMLPLVTRAAREVEQRLLNGSTPHDRLLQETFFNARRRTRGPVAAVGPGALLTNAAAARLLGAADRSRLWDLVASFLQGQRRVSPHFTLADGKVVDVCVEVILDGGEVAGALVRFPTPSPECEAPSALRSARSSRSSRRPAFGWDSLTEAEYCVTELVAEGLTNREVATRLFLSPHTVDSHLRHIFRKLDISSRMDLVRIVTARSVASRAADDAAFVA